MVLTSRIFVFVPLVLQIWEFGRFANVLLRLSGRRAELYIHNIIYTIMMRLRLVYAIIAILLLAIVVTVTHGQEDVDMESFPNNTSSRHPLDDDEAFLTEDDRNRLKSRQAEARRQKLMKDRKKTGSLAARKIIHASESDRCDWKQHPLRLVQGELCGSHYKVLGIDRKKDNYDKGAIKKAYRLASLSVHPDKNPSEEAQSAFKIVQAAYECLFDDFCKNDYDHQLAMKEQAIKWQRSELRTVITKKLLTLLSYAHYHISVGAHYLYQTSSDIWHWAGQWRIQLLGEEWSFGRPVLLAVLLWKGQLLLKIHAAAYLIERANYELAKYSGII